MNTLSKNKREIILVVDDIPANIQILSIILGKEYDIRVATNGKDALYIANSVDTPDLILLDILMPEMDGYEVCKKLKKNLLTSDIPVIFVTVKNEIEDEAKGFSLGAVDYIIKPFHSSIVRARVQTHLRLRKQAKLLEEYAFLDPLTLISNRRKFNTELDIEWRRALRNKTPLSLCMIDIDYFKLYNDILGHGEGDMCLQKVAATINRHSSRAGELVARYGGEEFIVLLPGCNQEQGYQSAQNIREMVEKLAISHPSSTVSSLLTLSIGCSTVYPSQTTMDIREFIKLTDDALYKAKKSGRNRIEM